MKSFFGHRGHEYFASDGPSLFAQRYSDWQMGKRDSLWPSPAHARYLNLRGSLERAARDAEQQRPASAPASVAGEHASPQTLVHTAEQATSLQVPTAVAGPVCPPRVTVQEVMSRVVADWEINVQEYEHLEWLLASGLVIPFNIDDVCEQLSYNWK